MAIEEILTGTVNDGINSLTAKGLEPKTIHNLWKDFRAVVNWHRKQMDAPKVAWYPDLPALPDDEQRWFTQAGIKQIVESSDGAVQGVLPSGRLYRLTIWRTRWACTSKT